MTVHLDAAERAVEAERIKEAWYAGFAAARHFPNHSQPELKVTWSGDVATVTPDWKAGQQRPGWIT